MNIANVSTKLTLWSIIAKYVYFSSLYLPYYLLFLVLTNICYLNTASSMWNSTLTGSEIWILHYLHPVRPDVGIKNSPKVPKSCQTSGQSIFFLKNDIFKIGQSPQIFRLLFKKTLPRTFKNRPIWSHCKLQTPKSRNWPSFCVERYDQLTYLFLYVPLCNASRNIWWVGRNLVTRLLNFFSPMS